MSFHVKVVDSHEISFFFVRDDNYNKFRSIEGNGNHVQILQCNYYYSIHSKLTLCIYKLHKLYNLLSQYVIISSISLMFAEIMLEEK